MIHGPIEQERGGCDFPVPENRPGRKKKTRQDGDGGWKRKQFHGKGLSGGSLKSESGNDLRKVLWEY